MISCRKCDWQGEQSEAKRVGVGRIHCPECHVVIGISLRSD